MNGFDWLGLAAAVKAATPAAVAVVFGVCWGMYLWRPPRGIPDDAEVDR